MDLHLNNLDLSFYCQVIALKETICGTVNDVAMMGAIPLYLSVGFIIEEGKDPQEVIEFCKKKIKESQEMLNK